MKYFLGVLISYLIGSIPTAYIFGRVLKGIDIRQHGSGNVGATNAFRVLGKVPGAIVLLLDILKGVMAVTLVGDLLGMTETLQRVLLSLVVVCGHNWTVFLNFKGGKGIATSLGALIGLTIKIAVIRPVLLVTVLMWGMCFLLTGFISLSSILASIVLPVVMVLTRQSIEIIALGVILCMFVVLRHRPNIKRLISKVEPRIKTPFVKDKYL